MKMMTVFLLGVLTFVCLGASSCEEKMEEANGVRVVKGPDGKYYAEVQPGGGPVQQGVKVAQDATSGSPLAPITALGSVAANLLQAWLLARAKARAAQMNDELAKAHDATNAGLQSFVDSQPQAVGHALIAELDHAHDAAAVSATMQDAIQPVVRTAA